MANERYLIFDHSPNRGLRSDGDFDGDVVEIDELSNSQVASLPVDVVAAPVVPLILAEPKQTEDDGAEFIETDAGKMAWGIQAVGAHTSHYTGQGVRVSVLDTGIDEDHPAFVGMNLIQKDFTSASASADSAPDTQGHGTHCAGTVFGKNVEGTRIGVAPGITDAIVGRVFAPGESASTMDLSFAINWSVHKQADVISMSLGMDFPGYVQQLQERFGYDIRVATMKGLHGYSDNVMFFSRLADSMKSAQAFGRPTFIVAASGNESDRTAENQVVLDAGPPASAKGISAIGALGRTGQALGVAPFSNALPVVSAPGVRVLSAAIGGGLKSLSGTSMATPHVAGLLALHIERLRAMHGGDVGAGAQALGDLLAGASTDSLVADWNRRDYGAGLAKAPAS